MTKKPTPSDKSSSLAGKALGGKKLTPKEQKSLAGALLRQDTKKGPNKR